MTISSTTRIAGPFIGTGVATVFPFTFKVFAASDLQVVRLNTTTGAEATLVLNTDYTVSLNQNQDSNPGGNVTLTAGALASGFTLTITSDIANLQPTDITNQGGFYPEVIEDSLDRATIQIQQMAGEVNRSIKFPISDGTLPGDLPSTSLRQGKYLAFDAAGQPTASAGTGTDTALRTDLAVTSVALAGSSLVGFRANSAASTGRTLLAKVRDTVSVKDFGAVGDGVTDDSAAIQAAVTAFRTVHIPSGTYVVTSQITVPSNTTIILDTDAIIDMSTALSGLRAFYAAGSVGAAYNLTTSTLSFGTTLTVSTGDSANFAAGDWVQVYSTAVFDEGWSGSVFGEIVQVDSVNTGTGVITLTTELAGGTYTTGATAQVRKVTFVENVMVTGGSFVGSQTVATLHTAVRCDFGINCTVDGIRTRYCNGNAINLRSCLFSTVKNVFVQDALGSTGYGVNITDCCQDCTVVDSSFLRCRHAVTSTSSDKGQSRRLTYQNLRSWDSINTGDAFDTHASSSDVMFVNCVSYGSSSNGFNIECASAQVIGCASYGHASAGIAFTTHTTVNTTKFLADGFRSIGGDRGISVGLGSPKANSLTTNAIRISNCMMTNLASGGTGQAINVSATGTQKTVSSVDTGTETITSTAHGYANGDAIRFQSTGGAVPGGLVAGTTYYVINAATNTYQVSATSGGSAENLTSIGSGTIETCIATTTNNVTIDGCYGDGFNTSGVVYVQDFVQNYTITGNIIATRTAGGSVLQARGQYGTIVGNQLSYTVTGASGASSSACIRITDAADITVGSNVGRVPSSSGGWGIRVTASGNAVNTLNNERIAVAPNNLFQEATNPGVAYMQVGQYSSLRIASGVVTLPHIGNGVYVLDTEGSAAADDLDTINGGAIGQQITLGTTASGRDIVVKDNTGNLQLNGDCTLGVIRDTITLYYNGANWLEMARSINN